jgi:glycosyltransferase involved in cell wall biosynthesis
MEVCVIRPKDTDGNILCVSNYASDVGYAWWLMEHFWSLLASIFEAVGCRAFLAYPKVKTIPESVASTSLEITELTLPWTNSIQKAKAKAFVKNNGITTIYFTDQPYFNIKYAELKHWGVKTIVVHDHTPGDRPPVNGFRGSVKSLRNRLDYWCADGVLCVSELMRRRSILNGRIPQAKCYTVQNGIVPLEPKTGDKSKVRKELGIPEGAFVVITTGRAHPYKRFDFVINAAAMHRQLYPNDRVFFLLVGDGPAMPHLRDQLLKLKLRDSVKLLGYRSDVRDLLIASDLAFHAALGEGFSLSIIEYMSSRLPVLVPDIPSVSQAVDHGQNGFVYDKDDVEAVARHIHTLASDRAFCGSLGRNAKDKADSKYSLKECDRQFKQAIYQVLDKKQMTLKNRH